MSNLIDFEISGIKEVESCVKNKQSLIKIVTNKL